MDKVSAGPRGRGRGYSVPLCAESEQSKLAQVRDDQCRRRVEEAAETLQPPLLILSYVERVRLPDRLGATFIDSSVPRMNSSHRKRATNGSQR